MEMPSLSLDVAGQLSASINGLAKAIDDERRRKENLAADIAYIETPPFTFTALPAIAGSGWGPNRGYNWAVQRITISGLGATTDYVNFFRGTATAHAVGNNALYTLQEIVAGGLATANPGRTGLVLKGDESLVLAGTFTGSTAYVSVDVIQLTDAQLPYFLL